MLDGVRILAVHHGAGRHGAALLFHAVLEGLTHDHGAAVTNWHPRPGALVERARAIGPTFVGPDTPDRRWKRRTTPDPAEHDLVLANSVASLTLVDAMDLSDGPPLVVFVHESAYLLRHAGNIDATVRALQHAQLIIVVSEGVKGAVEGLAQPTAPIVVVHPFAPGRDPQFDASRNERRPSTPGRPIIVGSVGTLTWYKGSDLFIVVARRVRELLPDHDVRFVWVGSEQQPEYRQQLDHDVMRADLGDAVTFAGEIDDPTEFYRTLRVLLLPSREDSWPLVMLEAAEQGVPMVCFRRSGGAEEFVAGGGGIAVPYLDVERMSAAVCQLLADEIAWQAASDCARAAAAELTARGQIDLVATSLATSLVANSGSGR